MSESPYRGESAVRLALKAREARQQAKTLLGADPIAVVGMACRVPGGGSTPDKLWQVLRDGVDAVRDIPADRWDGDAWYDPDMAAPGKSITKQGGFIDAIDQFDAGYFDILPREAEQMDPQQRLLLEVAIEALDDAGLPQPALAGSRTGVYIASYHNDYAKLSYAEREAIDPRTLTGTLHSVLANRVSYFLDLRGPSLSVDTACSSSLVAIHLACQSLRFGECDVALAGGVSLIITPDLMVSMSKVGFMAPDGRCKTFDAHADGFGRGEGCGVIVLKRLADAISDEDRVLAVIRGSAVNQDGRSTLLAAPNGPAQEALIREALGNARIEPGRIGFVEAHGTGTALGDPIEVEAIAATIGRPAPGYGDCLLGSAKANLGHLEAAAGVVGTIKAVLALRNEAIPGQVHYTAPNPHMNLAGTRLTVPKALTPWPKSGTPRCAAISSFGVGGTNAHIILEEAPGLPAPESEGEGESWQILPLSAKSPAALESLLRDWTAFLDDTPASLADLTHSAALRRTHFTARTAVVGRTKQEVRDRLAARLAAPLALERANADAPRMCFVFSGQGTQWHGMARELMDAEPVFRDVMEECDALLLPLSGWSILERLALPEAQAQFDDTGIAQPLLFAIQTALAELLKSWGVAPDAVIGHSIGEIAALHAAGVIDRAEAIRIVWHRGRIMQPAKDRGAMALVSLAEADARALAARFPGRLDIGAVNAPRASVLTGEPAALEEALASLGAGIDRRRLPVSYAFHGGQMEPLRAGLAAALGPVRWSAPQVPVYSTVTGALAGGEAFDLGYVLRNVRQEVRFADAVTNAAKDGFDLFVEIGPHPALGPAIESCLDAADRPGIVLHTLRRAKPEAEIIRQCAAGLYAAGCDLDWGAILPVPGALTTLPAYPWQKRRHWLRRRTAQTPQTEAGGHPLLGRRIEAAGLGAQIFEGRSTGTESWLPDHRIFGRILMPAAAIIEALWSAAAQTGGDDTQLAGFALDRPLVVPEPEAGMARWQVVARPGTEGTSTLELHEDAAPDWRRIAGTQALSGGAPFAPAPQAPLGEPISEEAIYARFNAAGVAFGPTFRLLREVRLAENFASGAIALPDELAAGASAHALHPVMLDAAFQLCWLAADRARADGTPAEAFLPVSVDRLKIVPGRHGWLRAQVALSDVGPRGLTANMWITTESGEAVAAVEGIQFVRADPASLAGPAGDLYDIGWETAEAVAPATLKGETLLLADAGGVAERLAAAIHAAGGRSRLIATDAVPDAAALAAIIHEMPA
ncbi:MAG TPA: beta-ketoacyl synthase N-terminal-like domain-containing protein, partial [Xanthobacteraceae bacterium]|nr:beta-ketoacyl synthase N-terminal-like domain-containing protein [Xanthobacteraceae bacterium]